ncbi:Retrovirus-related Pol polyprotein from transposon [Tetrabaena socialis]|uniref:Retrovirus-related Pol polyprotein from transposon n=1 Tax=Tetrabaena socialis TaxID=47790 RepID=A0A2J7ZR72_9CHLO|nr:Retrovirus-related Pol polyprotein from transposon [Tetrabaena socialis]|eukprot:PNH02775.1 Retrovirus-related Pol polyprotein from transposon [Tetrabaena socialis]
MGLLKKDAEGNWTDLWFYCDARLFNAATKPDMRTLRQGGSPKCNCRAAFEQIPMRAEDQEKTSSHWSGSLWQSTATSMASVTQRVMDHHICKAGCCCCYTSCQKAFSRENSHTGHKVASSSLMTSVFSAEQHYADFSRILDMLRDINIKLHPDKTVLVASEVEFPGHLVSARLQSKPSVHPATSRSSSACLLVLMNYYRGYLPRYSDLTAPLTLLTKNSAIWNKSTWLPEHQAALINVLKLEFSHEGLCLCRHDRNRPIILHTDFSVVGVSGVLGQQDDEGREYMCACVSRSLNEHP